MKRNLLSFVLLLLLSSIVFEHSLLK